MSPTRIQPLRSLSRRLALSRRLTLSAAFLCTLSALLPLTGCAGASSADGSGTPTRITMRDYRNGLKIELVNAAFDDRVSYYSSTREVGEAGRKFAEDVHVDGMVDYLRDRGWRKWSQDGNAPRDGANVITSSIELERGGETSHWKIGDGSESESRLAFIEAKQVFMVLYQETPGFQAIENTDGTFEFREPTSGRLYR